MKARPSIAALRAGVIGTGFVGPVHVEGLRRLGVTVSALCDIGTVATQAAERLAIPQAFADYRALVACSGVDVAHLTAPNRFHCPMASSSPPNRANAGSSATTGVKAQLNMMATGKVSGPPRT